MSRREWLKLGAVLAGLAIGLSLLGAWLVELPKALAHSDGGMNYPLECCHDRDCAPVTSATSEFGPTADGLMPQGMLLTTKYGTVYVNPQFPRQSSTDGRMHVCTQKDSAGVLFPICLFVPEGS